jgi:hypothetical protein
LAACADKEYFSAHRGCATSIPPPTAAKESFKKTLFSLILLRKINENSVFLKLLFGGVSRQMKASGFFTQPRCAEKKSMRLP